MGLLEAHNKGLSLDIPDERNKMKQNKAMFKELAKCKASI